MGILSIASRIFGGNNYDVGKLNFIGFHYENS